jgi:hypothetical protein
VKTALLRFAPVFTPLLAYDDALRREYMIERGAIVPSSYSKPTPVIVNHDEGRQIGTVRSFAVYDDVISGKRCAPFYFAHVDLTGPTAMQRGDGVSWGFRILREMELAGTKLIRSALINEVSVLTPGMKPAEPLAKVVWVGELEEAEPKLAIADRAAAVAVADDYWPPIWREVEQIVGYPVTDGNCGRALQQAVAIRTESEIDRLSYKAFGARAFDASAAAAGVLR